MFRYVCKSLDTKNGSNILKPVDWKFQSSNVFTKWHHLETLVDFDRLFPIERFKTPVSLKKQLQVLIFKYLWLIRKLCASFYFKDILKETSNTINSSLVIIEGELRSLDCAVETIGKQQQLTKEKKTCIDKENTDTESSKKILQVGLYTPCVSNNVFFICFYTVFYILSYLNCYI